MATTTISFTYPQWSAIGTRKQVVPMQCLGKTGSLDVPNLEVQARRGSLPQDYLKLLPYHIAFRQTAVGAGDEAKALARAQGELQAIKTTFPDLKKPSSILAMTATIFAYCAIDDFIEQMRPENVEALMKYCIEILQAPSQRHLRRASASQADDLYKKLDDLSKKTVKLTMAWQMHLSQLLPNAVDYDFVVEDICDCLQAFIDEAWYKAEQCSEIEEYLRIRTITVGVSTFMRIFQVDSGTRRCNSPAMQQLGNYVCAVVGIHNDLVGLDKDVRVKEWMNLALVISRNASEFEDRQVTLSEATDRTIMTCNALVNKSVQICDDISLDGSADEKMLAQEWVAVIERCLRWMKATKRYKS